MPSTLAFEGAHFYAPKECTKMDTQAHQKTERWTAVNTDSFVGRKGGFRDWCRSADCCCLRQDMYRTESIYKLS